MHGVKRSLVCFVAVASANPPFIQPSETSRETNESMNDGLIKLIRNARFLLNTPTAQQNHPRARHLRVATAAPAMRRRSSNCTAPTPHTRPAAVQALQGHPESGGIRQVHGWALSEESRPKFCCAVWRSQWGWSHVTSFFPGSAAASMERNGCRLQQPFFFIKFDTGMWCRRISFLRLVRGLSVFLRSPATTGHMSLRRLSSGNFI